MGCNLLIKITVATSRDLYYCSYSLTVDGRVRRAVQDQPAQQQTGSRVSAPGQPGK